jgi:hypothetical protein
MGFIDQHLMEGEQVVYRTRLHGIIFVHAIVWVAIATALTLYGNQWFESLVLSRLPREVQRALPPDALRWLRDGWHGYNLLGLVLLGLSALPGLLGSLVNYLTSEFGVSNKRVLLKTGFLSRHSLETMLSKVESIGVFQGLLGRLLGFGTIIIGGTGGSKEAFFGIRDPLEFRRQVQEQIARGGS